MSSEETKDYSKKYDCFGHYGEASTEWNPDNELYILCQNCSRNKECYKEKHK